MATATAAATKYRHTSVKLVHFYRSTPSATILSKDLGAFQVRKSSLASVSIRGSGAVGRKMMEMGYSLVTNETRWQ